MKYLGIGYNDLMNSPSWVFDLGTIRMIQDNKEQSIQNQKLAKKNKHLNSKYA